MASKVITEHLDHPLVYQAGTGFNMAIAAMFHDAGWRGTRELLDADLIVFTGGADINPELYHEKKIPQVRYVDDKRDSVEIKEFEAGKEFGIPMVGICRGAQFLNVMNGGRLWQDVDKHTVSHMCQDLRTGETFTTTSTHHQMMRPTQTALIVAAAVKEQGDLSSISTLKRCEGMNVIPGANAVGANIDPEVVWYEDTLSLCFQGHPEYPSNTQAPDRFWQYLDEFIMKPKKDEAA